MSSNVKAFANKLFPIIYKTTGALIILRAASAILPHAITSRINIFSQSILTLTSRFISIIFTGSSTNSLDTSLADLTNDKARLLNELIAAQTTLNETNKKLREADQKVLRAVRAESQARQEGIAQGKREQAPEIASLRTQLDSEKRQAMNLESTVGSLRDELKRERQEKERLQQEAINPEAQRMCQQAKQELVTLQKTIESLNAEKLALEEGVQAAETALREVEKKTEDRALNSTAARVLRFASCLLTGKFPDQPVATSNLSGRLEERFATKVGELNSQCLRKAQAILASPENLFKNVPAFTQVKDAILEQVTDVLKKHIDYTSEKRPTEKGHLLIQKKEQVTALINYLKENNIQAILEELSAEDEPPTLLINAIKNCEQKLNKEVERLEHERLISRYKPSENLTTMTASKIATLYSDCLKKDNTLKKLQKELDKLIDRANLKAKGIHYGIKIEFTGKEGAPFQISSANQDNVSMGYSIFNFLCEAKIIPDDQEWNGEQTFALQEQDLNTLNDYLGRLDRWFDDFSKGISDLLCVTDPEEYINVGQKQAYEILVSGRRCTAEGRKTLSYLPGDHLCLLLGQVGLNLENHPERDFIKEKLTKIYRQEEMKSFDGKYKQFVIGTYQTNLSTSDVKKIAPRLNKLLKFQQYLMEKSGKASFKQALEHFKRQGKEEFDLLKEYYTQISIDAVNVFVQDASLIRRQVEAKFRGISADIAITPDNFQTLDAKTIRSVDSLEKACEEISGSFLQEKTAPHFKKHPPSYTPSAAAITALYGTTAPKSYGTTHGVFRDLKKLFDSLKRSGTVQSVLEETPEIENKLDGLREALEERLINKYPALLERGWPSSKELIREAISSLEIYVASVVNTRESHVSAESIKTSLAQITGLDIGELKRGCDEGLTGRILSLSIALSNDMGGGLEASVIQQQKELLESALVKFTTQESYDTYNSSHDPVYLSELRNYLGIARREGEAEKTYATLSPNAKKMFNFFLEKNKPMDIYSKAKGFFEHSLWVETLETDNEANREKMYQTLIDLGFGDNREDLDRKYRIQGNRENGWQYAFIKEDLPKYLPSYLIQKGFLVLTDTDAQEGYLYCRKAGEPLQSINTKPPQPNYDRYRAPAAAYVPPEPRREQPQYVYQAPPVYYGG